MIRAPAAGDLHRNTATTRNFKIIFPAGVHPSRVLFVVVLEHLPLEEVVEHDPGSLRLHLGHLQGKKEGRNKKGRRVDDERLAD
jgi:hypothetical protein